MMNMSETTGHNRRVSRPGPYTVRTAITTALVSAALAAPAIGWCGDDAATRFDNPWPHLLHALAYLLVVIGLIVLTWYVLRRVSSGVLSPSEEGPLEVIQTVSVGQGRMLCLAEVAGRVYLVAWTDGSAEVIGEFESSEIDEPPE